MQETNAIAPFARAELEKARERLSRGADPIEVLEDLGRSLTNKLLHPEIERLKRSA